MASAILSLRRSLDGAMMLKVLMLWGGTHAAPLLPHSHPNPTPPDVTLSSPAHKWQIGK